MPRRTASIVVTWLGLALLAAASAVAALGADRTVAIEDFAYAPSTVTIRVGDTVTWTNRDALAHTATGDGWDTGDIEAGASAAIRFDRAGTYAYLCTPHPTMTGTIVVRAAGGGGGATVTPPPGDTIPPSMPAVAPPWWPLAIAFAAALVVGLLRRPRGLRR
jgi:plastocyanin